MGLPLRYDWREWHHCQEGVEVPMSARDFIDGTLKAVTRFLEESRHLWDVPE